MVFIYIKNSYFLFILLVITNVNKYLHKIIFLMIKMKISFVD